MTQEQTEHKRILEAMLFASAEPLSLTNMREKRGVNLIEVDNQWAFRTASDLGEALQLNKEVQRKLSRAAMETLAIIAYHQPVTRAEIENIRGVATHRGTLDVLMEAGWVKPGRRRNTPGRPLTWVTCTAFLDHFGLESMMDLPGMDDLKASGLLDRRPAIDTVPGTADLFGEEDEAEELDEYIEEEEQL
jgi:segregation and condensation protein B